LKILIFSPTPSGGLAEHAHYQAQALHRIAHLSGLDIEKPKAKVTLLCSPDFLHARKVEYKKAAVFSSDFSLFGRFFGRAGELLDKSLKIIGEQWRLALEVLLRKPDVVLLSSYSEYLAPFWVLPHCIVAKLLGVVYVANLHDPVRDYVLGPKWWHDLSVKMAYWPISVGVVHQRLPELSPVPKHVQVVEAPVGVYDLQESPEDPEAIRAAWGVRKEKSETLKLGKAESRNSADCGNALDSERSSLDTSAHADVVFLAFGFIRDNKNLDLVIRALVENPEALLVVMGKAQSKKDKPVDFYRNLARELGVSDRVRFFDEFVPDEKLASYFAAADVVLLTYDKTFHSQSGVLNVAARARRPVLASAGESPLKDCVQRYGLGVFVEPDNLDALKRGMEMVASDGWQVASGEPDWDGYENFASWDENVAKILEAVEKVKH
jgi:glycosyltransferase involved in cell wall biosynthesis